MPEAAEHPPSPALRQRVVDRDHERLIGPEQTRDDHLSHHQAQLIHAPASVAEEPVRASVMPDLRQPRAEQHPALCALSAGLAWRVRVWESHISGALCDQQPITTSASVRRRSSRSVSPQLRVSSKTAVGVSSYPASTGSSLGDDAEAMQPANGETPSCFNRRGRRRAWAGARSIPFAWATFVQGRLGVTVELSAHLGTSGRTTAEYRGASEERVSAAALGAAAPGERVVKRDWCWSSRAVSVRGCG
jgi:hypothetical protein